MHPILFQSGSFTLYTYGVLVAAGVLLGLWYARTHARREGLNPQQVWNLGIYIVFGSLIVSKIWLLASDWRYYFAHPSDIFSAATLQSAGTFYGGFLGGALTLIGYAYYEGLPLLPLFDIVAPSGALAHAIGRLGCFAAGCCFGRPTSLPFGVTFHSDTAAQISGTPLNVPLHPTQLYEAAAEFLNFLLLIWLGGRQRFRGQLFGTYFILYGIERGVIEFFRGDPGRTLLFDGRISLMQIVSAGLVITGAFLWWRGLRRGAELPLPSAPHSVAGA